jgi:hypothetical protein
MGIVIGDSGTLLRTAAALDVAVLPLYAAIAAAAGRPTPGAGRRGVVYRAASWDEVGLALWGE